ncbi:MAG: ABC transporter substrate-binding protein [Rhodospirillales bacterium]|nr:ABC transporter substrate-binding protein [Rhodospirillales bacterium]
MKRREFAAALAALAAAGTRGARAAEMPAVPVGLVAVLSGPAAAYGNAIRAGVELALAEVNAKDKLIALTVADSGGTKDGAINAARKLIGRDHVAAIIGPTLSNSMFAMGPVTNGRGIPTIGTSTTANGITDIGPFIFRTALPEADVIPVTMKKAVSRGVRTIALMYANDDAFSKSGYEVMKAAAQGAGLKILTTESFGSKDTDFSAQLTAIKAKAPNAIGISALVEPVSGVLLQARQLGFGKETLFIGGNGSNSPKLGQIAGAAADGLIVGSPWFVAKPDPLNRKFVQSFRAKYGHDPDQFAAQAYDTLFILAEAIRHAGGPDPQRIRKALIETNHVGVLGPFRFDARRNPASTEGVVVLEMHGGQFRIAA